MTAEARHALAEAGLRRRPMTGSLDCGAIRSTDRHGEFCRGGSKLGSENTEDRGEAASGPVIAIGTDRQEGGGT